MHLKVGDVILPIAQLGPDFIILESPIDLPTTEGEITLRVDASERRWPVTLPDGLSATAQRTRIARK